MVCVYAVFFEEADDALAHSVVSGLADECGFHAGAPQRDYAVECRTAGYCSYRLVVLEDNIKYGFPDTNNFSHRHFINNMQR